jgi:ribosomal-protein-alanine N-acetyltransferase
MNPDLEKTKMGAIKLYTDRLVIRPFCEQDAEAYFQLFAHPKVHCFVGEKLDGIEEAGDEIQKKQNQKDGSELAVCLKGTDAFIGTVFGRREKDAFSVCWNFRSDYCGPGYACEAAKADMDFLFKQMHARRIDAYVEDYHTSSQRLCRKLGMRQEGIFKEYISLSAAGRNE